MQEHQRLATSGARGVTPFWLEGNLFLAVPQLARDIAGVPADMNGGDSDVATLIYRWTEGRFALYQEVEGHGNEDAKVFQIGRRTFLAVASIREGHGPYTFAVPSVVHEWDGQRFSPFQSLPGFAAKNVCHFTCAGHDFLAVANGVPEPRADTASRLYRWEGDGFREFFSLPSRWAYGLAYAEVGPERVLGLTDHLDGSTLYRWTGEGFEPFQRLADPGARELTFFELDGTNYLAAANLTGTSTIFAWTGSSFRPWQSLEGPGGHNLRLFRQGGRVFLARINFLTGDRCNPKPDLESLLYAWDSGRFIERERFATFGGTGAACFHVDGVAYLAVSNSLSRDLRFATDTVIYVLGKA